MLLLRTMSKGYSLAGLLRLRVRPPRPDHALDKARDSYNTDILAQAAAVAAITHRATAKLNCEKVIQERRRLGDELARMGWWVWPSDSNFILAQPPETPGSPDNGPNAREIYESLKQQRVFVRYFDQDRLRDKLRITIGTPEQNDTLLRALTLRAAK
ncbi:MAG: aminotransferase class I/II-fold pyridoxal phosphate-dependent enzyme [Phycisphaerales bacterium]